VNRLRALNNYTRQFPPGSKIRLPLPLLKEFDPLPAGSYEFKLIVPVGYGKGPNITLFGSITFEVKAKEHPQPLPTEKIKGQANNGGKELETLKNTSSQFSKEQPGNIIIMPESAANPVTISCPWWLAIVIAGITAILGAFVASITLRKRPNETKVT
jgi:hypothetical protein